MIREIKESELYHGRLVQCLDAGRKNVFKCIYKITIDDGIPYYIGCSNDINTEPIHDYDDLVFPVDGRIQSPGDVWLETDITFALNRCKKLNDLLLLI
jgi:hypothetical protein